ncbi:hypothetical protein [Undibacterium umbellatum]|uniref:Uncharacterized protein n=1 Tax=Undibacterium umbellatum TaxID=2762300 RepID=A0ABR6ZHL3_9BURK|nr:hypothetical protein [Undibacterium umbellatum]MBC3911232.1 hypothetical protein [Undibacterium umbellatum]
MIEVIFSNISNIIGTILIAALVAWFSYRNGSKVRKATACETFRKAISTSLQGLYPIPVDWPDSTTGIRHILNRQFPVIQAAVNEFRNYVPWYSRKKFDKAWRQYRNAYEDDESAECYHHYESFEDNSDHKAVFKANVDRLMSFAKDV